MILKQHAKLFWVLILLAGPWQSAGQAQAADEPAPSYTAQQAFEGRKAYAANCSVCHGANLEGFDLAPPLVGSQFDLTWRGKSADILLTSVRRMPIQPGGDPGSLSKDTYANIMAFILKSNGLAAGEEPLPNRVRKLGGLIIPGGVKFDSDDPMIGAGSELLDNLPPVTEEMLKNPSPNDWLHWGRTYDGQSFSPLKQINKENVKSMKMVWRSPLRGGTSMPMPLVHHGVMYLHTYPDTVLAMDASNGMVLWRHKRKPDRTASQKMGLALHGDKLLVPTSDLHVLALNAKTGEQIWDHKIEPDTEPRLRGYYQLRSAPFVVGKNVIQGITASGAPKGGFMLAVDLETGEESWRFNTIARPGEPFGNSWNGLPLEGRSGGSIWHQSTYDSELNLIYFGVAPTYDTGPLLHSINQEGINSDAMYTNCTVALDADTGELVWQYQHMANDQWDLDWAFERQIVNVPVDGVMRKVVMNTGKMAILEALDAATGEYLFSVDPGVQNVITAIDPVTGAKTYDPEKIPDPDKYCVVCPIASGARSWPQTSYSPETKLVYLPLSEWCMGMGPEGFQLLSAGAKLSSAVHPDTADGWMGRVQAIDVVNQKLAWNTDQLTPPSTSLLATSGGLVFSGDIDPSLKAFDDTTGELLWEAPLDDLPSSGLVTYSVEGKQYLAVVVGLTNNHIRDLSRTFKEFVRLSEGKITYDPPEAGAAIVVFALEEASS